MTAPSTPVSEIRLAAIIESSDDAIMTKDRDAIITSWNPAAERMYGYSADEAVGQPVSILIPEDRAGEERMILDRVLAGDRIDHYESERVHKNGELLRVSLSVSPLSDESGEVVGASIIARDTTSLDRSREFASRLHELTRALSSEITRDGAVRCLLEQAVGGLGVDAGAVGLLDPSGTEIELVGSSGYTDAGLSDWQRFPLDADVPMSIAVRTGEAIWTESADELRSDYPALSEAKIQFASLAVIPLRRGRSAVRGAGAQLRRAAPVRSGGAHVSGHRRPAGGADAGPRPPVRDRAPGKAADLLPGRRERAARGLARSGNHPAQPRRARDPGDGRLVRDRPGRGRGRTAQRRHGSRRSGEGTPRGGPSNPVSDRSRCAHRSPERDPHRALGDLSGDTGRAAREGSGRRGAPPVDARARALLRNGRAAQGQGPHPRGDNPRHLRFRAPVRDGDLELAEDLARRAALAIDNSMLFHREHESALMLQRSMLPASLPRLPGVELAAHFQPAAPGLEVGGDWYDVVRVGETTATLTIGDIAGRGIQAATVMGRVAAALRAYVLDGKSPDEALRGVNRLMRESGGPEMATVLHVQIDLAAGTADYVRAGHPPGLIRLPGGEVERLGGEGTPPLGTFDELEYRIHRVAVPPGSLLLLYTDGLIERSDRDFDVELRRLCAALAEAPDDPEECLQMLAERFGAESIPDDMAMLAMSRTQAPEGN